MGCCGSAMLYIPIIKYLAYGEKENNTKDELLDKYSTRWKAEEAVVFDKNELQLQLDGNDTMYTCSIKYGNIQSIEYLDKYSVGGDNNGTDIERVIKITLKKRKAKLGQCIYFGPIKESQLQEIKDIVFKN